MKVDLLSMLPSGSVSLVGMTGHLYGDTGSLGHEFIGGAVSALSGSGPW